MERQHANLIKIWSEDKDIVTEFLTPGGKWVQLSDTPNFAPLVSYRLRDTGMIVSFSPGLKNPVKEKEPEYNITW